MSEGLRKERNKSDRCEINERKMSEKGLQKERKKSDRREIMRDRLAKEKKREKDERKSTTKGEEEE
jgi:hypothetical protein